MTFQDLINAKQNGEDSTGPGSHAAIANALGKRLFHRPARSMDGGCGKSERGGNDTNEPNFSEHLILTEHLNTVDVVANSGAEMGLDKVNKSRWSLVIGHWVDWNGRDGRGAVLWVPRCRHFAHVWDIAPSSARCVGGRGTPLKVDAVLGGEDALRRHTVASDERGVLQRRHRSGHS